jgi:transcriptional regulator with XRE-family HTH domain
MAGSSAPLRRLGIELRRLREATGRTQGDVGKAIGRTHATLVNWELGKTKIGRSDLVCLLAELRVPVEVRGNLERLRDEVGYGKGPWAAYGLPDWLRALSSFEEDAVRITAFDPVIVPGLLQTEDYARSIHLAGPYQTAPSDVDRWVAARMLRQARVTGSEALLFQTVVPEAALRLQIGGPSVLAAQLEWLLVSASAENVALRVLPATAGAHPALASNFSVLHFMDAKSDPPLGYFDGPVGGYLISDQGEVADMINMFDDVRSIALAEAESAEMIAAVLKEIREKGS